MPLRFLTAPAASGTTKSLIVLLHGYGANSQDLIGLAEDWAESLPDTTFISPDAPDPCEMAPFGRQWFSLSDWSPATLSAGAEKSAGALNDFLDDRLTDYHLTEDKLALVGFSQGTMMALYVAPRRRSKIAGVLGYSGALLGAEAWAREQIQKPPICLIHGMADPVVPVTACSHAESLLRQNDFPVESHILPGLMHGIDHRGLEIGAKFLHKILS